MLYDLNVPWLPIQSPAELEQTIIFLSSLGYHALALNHSVSALPSLLSNPIPTTHPFTLPSKTTLLRRCTLTISDPSQNHRLAQLATHYDLIALRPTTEKAYLAACQSLDNHALISLDLTQRFPFPFKPKPLMTAINRGIAIEICYAQATLEDAGARRNFISNSMAIMRATKGRGLVVSSGAASVLGVRPPADVINLMSVWGLSRDRGTESIGVNPRGVVVNEGLKRSSFRGVIDVVDGGEREVRKEPVTPAKGEAAGKKGKNKQKPESASGNEEKFASQSEGTGESIPPNGKRKSEEDTEGQPQMSKTQRKKMRLAQMKADKEGTENTSTSETPVTKPKSSKIRPQSDG